VDDLYQLKIRKAFFSLSSVDSISFLFQLPIYQ
jgi:hypothetical protein